MYRVITILFLMAALGMSRGATAQSKDLFNGFQLVDKAGHIRKPDGYQKLFHLIGSYMVLDPNGNQMHNTYASPGAAEYYRRTGKFVDGTVLVKEVDGTEHAQLTTGNANWAADTKVWFVLIKDSKGRFPNNPLWGDGWGWALFKADAPDKQVATNYMKDCLGCHTPAKESDLIYVNGYPVLHSK
jgi:Cytochrome P460